MRVAVIVVGLVVVSTPSQASRSCMTQAEARRQFATSHLYWHGSHCWDAMTPSRRVVHRVRENVQREAQRDPAEPDNSSHCGNANLLSLELRQGDKILRRSECRFES